MEPSAVAHCWPDSLPRLPAMRTPPTSARVGRAARRWRTAIGFWALRHGRVADRDLESRLVWVFGSPRSGSTWLLRLLAEHESVVPVDEPLIGSYLGPFM